MTPRAAMRGRARALRLTAALLASTALVTSQTPFAVAGPVTARTYDGPAYSTQIAAPPTHPENQSKLWFHAGAWWALLLEPTGQTVRVFELMADHTWRPTSAVVNSDASNVGDALRDGDTVHVTSRRTDGSLHYVRLTFDPVSRDYRAGPPGFVVDQGTTATASIAKDTTGRLWVGYATADTVVVTHSDDGATWAAPIVLATRDASVSTEMAALVSYDDRVGILWSDQSSGSFEFASHADGDDPTVWARERALSGPAQADDHISLKRVDGSPADTLVAAVKTSRGDHGEPLDSALIEVLVRAPGGVWSSVPAGSVADGLNDAIVQVDQATGSLHLFASHGGSVVHKRAPLGDITFQPGPGSVFMPSAGGGLFAPTGTKEPVDARSGLVVLASDITTHRYRHAEMAIASPAPAADPNDRTPPQPPDKLRAKELSGEAVLLSWAEVTDQNQWAPARNGVPAQAYVVLRDGIEVATVSSTSLRDVRPAKATKGPVKYAVHAVDSSGNRSEPASIVVDPSETAGGSLTALLVGLGLVGLLGALVGYAVLRQRRLR